ncbi:MAG: ABC transporter permease [Adhaeribacter sp.]
MLKNYFTTAYRNLFRHKAFSAINIAGLTLGLAACLLIGLFVYDELQYDRFLPGGERVYRLYNDVTTTEGRELVAGTPPMFATTLQQEFPEVMAAVRILRLMDKYLMEEQGKQRYEEGGIAADAAFFRVFPLSFVYGSPEKALADPGSLVVSQAFARRLFGAGDPTGKAITFNKQQLVIKGVFADNPRFHLPINFILPLPAVGFPAERMQSWSWQQFYTYVKLKPATKVTGLQDRFQDYVKSKVMPRLQERNFSYQPYFQPLQDIYLHSADFKFDMARKGNITYVRALGLIAGFILLIAIFNFVNLATAKSTHRAREVGVRKAIGAHRGQLMTQFIGETVLLTAISVVAATALTSLFLPALNAFTGKQMTFQVFGNPSLALGLLALTAVVGLLAGFYPALVLSGYQPVKVLKAGGLTQGRTGSIPWLRHGLIVVQFALSIFLITSALVVFKQVSFLHHKDLGFRKDQIMFFPMRGEQMFQHYQTFKEELRQVAGVAGVSIGYGFPGDAVAGDGVIVPRQGRQIHHSVTILAVDHDYLSTLGVPLVAGRGFSAAYKTDADQAFLINETAARELGYGSPRQALDQPLIWETWDQVKPRKQRKGRIIGVVKDFHYKSLFDRVEPTVLLIYPDANWKVAVKLGPQDMAGTIAQVKQVWKRFSPDFPIEYVFLDESFAGMYQAEDKLRTLLWIFTGLAIGIACLGLFGLSAYAAERRKKEIGIRKVLGADTRGLVALLSREFLYLVAVAALLAFPLAWYAMQVWLQHFAYRIAMPLEVFGIAGLAAAGLAFGTVSYQALRAATANPVRNLRTE